MSYTDVGDLDAVNLLYNFMHFFHKESLNGLAIQPLTSVNLNVQKCRINTIHTDTIQCDNKIEICVTNLQTTMQCKPYNTSHHESNFYYKK